MIVTPYASRTSLGLEEPIAFGDERVVVGEGYRHQQDERDQDQGDRDDEEHVQSDV